MKEQAKRSAFYSIKTTMILSFSALIIVALAVFLLLSINYTEDTVLENSSEYTLKLVQKVNEDMDSYINYMGNICDIVVNNQDVIDYFFQREMGSTKKITVKSRIYGQFITLKKARDDIHNIGVVKDNKEYAINNGDYNMSNEVVVEELKWYQDALAAQGKTVLSATHAQNIIWKDSKWVVTLSRGIRNPRTNQFEAVIFVDLDYDAIENLCAKISLGEKGYLFVVDENENLIYHPKLDVLEIDTAMSASGDIEPEFQAIGTKQSGSFLTSKGKERKLYTVSKSEVTGWSVVGVAYTEELMGNQQETQLSYLLLSMVLFLFATVIASVISSQITKPIKQLQAAMKAVEKGEFEKASPFQHKHNEIGSLADSFQIMTGKIQQLMEENIEEQRAKRKSELKALQSQINPHFLYNTLDSIIWMAEGGKSSEVVLMTSSLSKLLRQSISNEEEMVSIQKEVQYVREYLTIQKMRYKDKLEFTIQMEPDVLHAKIVKLVLQPLAENAIYHGIKYKEGKGEIKIHGWKEEKEIVLTIEDNGAGMSEADLQHIFEKKERISDKGVGVLNVQDRLQLFFGKEYGLRFSSVKNEGTCVEIRIPYIDL